MSEAYKKLIKTLRTLFEMDKADLDFGIYRILNQKRDEIGRFLDEDLLPQVRAAFANYAGGARNEVQAELEALIKTLTDAGIDPEQSPKVAQLRAQAATAVDITAVENEVYSHLHTFFSRYYDQGDFISQRRYKADTYAIPYEGEEVKLYWANHDQYYVKSSEHLRDYAFTVHDDDGRTVRIKLVEADTEKDNVKAPADQERRFVLDAEQPLHLEGDELQIRFQYVPAGRKKQDALNAEAVATIFAQPGYDDWLNLLRKPATTEANPKRTLLEKHLNDYTSRNTFDYFIHKDLGGFLRRELDFYIKSEVLHLDDVDDAAFAVTEAHLRKIKVLRSVAHKLIRMLAQLEDFQKTLWLKKKFVIETHYCMTLDRVPKELYPTIAANHAQYEEWKTLFSIGASQSDLASHASTGALEVSFLEAHQGLVVDTRFFDSDFKHRLLASLDDFDEQVDGVLVNSDNFQALVLFQDRYRGQAKCIYIDPPYNTDSSEILYKNGYKASSWDSLLNNTTQLGAHFLKENGILCATIDDEQQPDLAKIMSQCFGRDNVLGTVCIRINPSGRITLRGFAQCHEYALFLGKTTSAAISKLPRSDAQLQRFNRRDKKGLYEQRNFRREGSSSERESRPRRFFPIYVDVSTDNIRVPELDWEETTRSYKALEQPKAGESVVYPIDSNGGERVWRWGIERVARETSEIYPGTNPKGELQIYYKYRPNEEGVLPTTVWTDKEYSATEYGTAMIKALFGGRNEFSFPKSLNATKDCVNIATGNEHDATIIDYFAGSGTTGHAVINLNREDSGRRKYILVEAGGYFDTVVRPRIAKAIYCKEWKAGRPMSQDNISHCFKYLRMESYEDALNNLLVRTRTKRQQDILDNNPTLREDYMLGYWLDVETADSPSMLNVDQFEDPFNYKLNIAMGSVGAFKPTVVDLVETFNYLLGLRVKTMDTIRGFMVVTGSNPQDESVLVIWRKVKEQDNAALEAFMDKQGYNPKDTEFDHIYVNGDHTLEDPHSKVKMTEIEFKRLMFDMQDV